MIQRRSLLGGTAAIASLPLIARPARAAPITLRIGNDGAANHPVETEMVAAAERIKQRTEGAVVVANIPSSQLGAGSEILAPARSGAVEGYFFSSVLLSSVAPDAGISGMGFAFGNYETAWKALDGGMGDVIRASIRRAGLVPMDTVWEIGLRHVATNTVPITDTGPNGRLRRARPRDEGTSSRHRQRRDAARAVARHASASPIRLAERRTDNALRRDQRRRLQGKPEAARPLRAGVPDQSRRHPDGARSGSAARPPAVARHAGPGRAVPAAGLQRSSRRDGALRRARWQRGRAGAAAAARLRHHRPPGAGGAAGNIVVVPACGHGEHGEEPGSVGLFSFQDGRLAPLARMEADPAHAERWRGVRNGAHGFAARHVAFHPSRPWMFLCVETTGEIRLYDYDEAGIALQPRAIRDKLEGRPPGRSSQMASAIHVHPDGRHVYVSNRAWDTEPVDGQDVFVGGVAAVLGLDAFFIGRGDLITAMELESSTHPRVHEAVALIAAAAKGANLPVMVLPGSKIDAVAMAKLGATTFIISNDQSFLMKAAREALSEYAAPLIA